MPTFNFADAYKSAGFSPGPEVIDRRQAPVSAIINDISTERILDLARLYFGLPVPKGVDWFRDAFAEHDASFSLVDNSREVSVLSGCILAAAMEEGYVSAALSILTISAAGNRMPPVQHHLVEDARTFLRAESTSGRRPDLSTLNKIALAQKSKASAASDKIAQSHDMQETAAAFKLVAGEIELLLRVASSLRAANEQLNNEVASLREEVEILWWYIGGWSRVLNTPLSNLSEALVAAMAGFDLASLTESLAGHIAAPAILERLIGAGRKQRLKKIGINDAVDAMPEEALPRLSLSEKLRQFPDVCPVLAAFLKASEVGASPAWHKVFKVSAHIDPEANFSPIEMAMQVYREGLLLKILG